jgi:mannosyltransferase OCH1-like enzyme
MIPKIIHYCWFGPNKVPPMNQACIQSWADILGDYEVIKWDESNCPKNEYIEYHLKEGNWAFVSDYVRLYALYNFGGIYLDTDIEVVKPFDALLSNKGFLAYEDEKLINNAVSGGMKFDVFFNDCMKYMENRHKNGEDIQISPVVTTTVLNSADYDITVYDRVYFYPYNPYDDKQEIKNLMFNMVTADTYAIHHWAKSWEVKKKKRKGLIGIFCSALRIILKKLDK